MIVEIIFTDPIVKSREVCVKFFEFVDQVINYFHVDTIELVVLDQWRKATINCVHKHNDIVRNQLHVWEREKERERGGGRERRARGKEGSHMHVCCSASTLFSRA